MKAGQESFSYIVIFFCVRLSISVILTFVALNSMLEC